MLTFVIIGLFIIVGVILARKGYKENNGDLFYPGVFLGVLATAIVIILMALEVQWPRDTELIKAEYIELQREVKQVSKLGGSECDLTILARKDLFEAVREMNKTIDKHKIYHNSLLVNCFYSEEIGNLPKLDYIYIEE